jgi:hypothetical protein
LVVLVRSLWLPPSTLLAFGFKGEYPFKSHFFLAKRAVFVAGSEDNSQGAEEIDSEQGN